MKSAASWIALVAALAACRDTGAIQAVPGHDREFYRSVADHPETLPAGTSALELTLDLQRWIGDPDPELRDEFAYSLPAVWIRRGLVPDEELRHLVDGWCANLEVGIGNVGDNGVLKRSFSILALDSALSREGRQPFLGAPAVVDVCERLLRYFENERDLRDWDPQLGWIHALAHTADALRRCAAHPAVDDVLRTRIVTTLETRLRTVDHVFTHGENRRFAAVLFAVVARTDGDVTPVVAWRNELATRESALWSVPVLDPALFARVENETQVFESLLAQLTALPLDHAQAALVRAALRER